MHVVGETIATGWTLFHSLVEYNMTPSESGLSERF